MTNDKLADEIEMLSKAFDALASHKGGKIEHRAVAAAKLEATLMVNRDQIIAALRERPQPGEMVMPCSITVGAARFGVGVKVETVQAAINRAFVRLQNAEHIEGKLRELLVGTLPFFELLEKIRLAAAEAERGKT